jgi:hypothetical protein
LRFVGWGRWVCAVVGKFPPGKLGGGHHLTKGEELLNVLKIKAMLDIECFWPKVDKKALYLARCKGSLGRSTL